MNLMGYLNSHYAEINSVYFSDILSFSTKVIHGHLSVFCILCSPAFIIFDEIVIYSLFLLVITHRNDFLRNIVRKIFNP